MHAVQSSALSAALLAAAERLSHIFQRPLYPPSLLPTLHFGNNITIHSLEFRNSILGEGPQIA